MPLRVNAKESVFMQDRGWTKDYQLNYIERANGENTQGCGIK